MLRFVPSIRHWCSDWRRSHLVPDRARLSRWLWHARYVNACSGQPNPGDAAVAGVVCEAERK